MTLKFRKMHGLGNDFVVIDLRNGSPLQPREKIAALTDRRTGIGCDQFIPIMPPQDPKADAFMRILNAPDASEAEACGNATRCVAKILMDEKGDDRAVIQTVAGLLYCTKEKDGRITVDMGVPKFGWKDIPLSHDCDTLHLPLQEGEIADAVAVNVGNPHAVFFIGNVEGFPVAAIGPRFEHDPLFPRKANIEFAEVRSRSLVRMRVWERDTGETQACGSAACATYVAAVRRGLVERRGSVQLNGGTLDFYWREDDDHILMTGPATHVYDGVIEV